MATMHEIAFEENTLLKLKAIQQSLMTDDPRITAEPIFQVREKVRVYGITEGYGEDGFSYYDSNSSEPIEEDELEKWLEEYGHDMEAYKNDPETFLEENGIGRVFWRWDNTKVATSCFTDQGCKDYIAIHKNNLTNPYIYVDSLFRNAEMIFLRNFLMQFPLDNF